jgi:hypothetical protein
MDTRSQAVAEIRIIGPGEAGLMDRLRLVVFPQILGETGREPLFAGLPDIGLELVETDVLDGRLVALEYRPANAHPTAEPRR